MELIPINDSKLKIMLDESDMKKYNIGDEADCANSETRQAIRNILDHARDQIGFDTEGSEIFVQLYTSKRGGCELFVTKSSLSVRVIGSCAGNEKKSKKRAEASQGSSTDRYALPSHTDGAPTNKRNDRARLFFSFRDVAELCKACKRLSDVTDKLESSAYRGDNGIFYLSVRGDCVREFARLDKLTFMLEFGDREKGYDVSAYLDEHAKVICASDAVGALGQFS